MRKAIFFEGAVFRVAFEKVLDDDGCAIRGAKEAEDQKAVSRLSLQLRCGPFCQALPCSRVRESAPQWPYRSTPKLLMVKTGGPRGNIHQPPCLQQSSQYFPFNFDPKKFWAPVPSSSDSKGTLEGPLGGALGVWGGKQKASCSGKYSNEQRDQNGALVNESKH